MLATDALSLVFLTCIVFSGVFLIASSALGLGHAHLGLHSGAHLAHAGVHTAAPSGGTQPVGLHAGAHAVHTTAHGAHGAHGAHAAHATHATQATTTAASATSPAALWHAATTALLGALNLYGVLMFLLVFGLLGYILHNAAHAAALVAIVLPLLLGAFCAAGTSALLRRLFTSGAASELTLEGSRAEGRIGTVIASIRPGGVGEVLYTRPGGGRLSVSARASDDEPITEPITVGTEVVILSFDDGIARVQPWDSFLASARASNRPAVTPPDAHP